MNYRKIAITGDYLVDIRTGILFKKVTGVNQRWKAHRENNRMSVFYVKYNIFNEYEDRKNVTVKQVRKSLAGATNQHTFRVFNNYDLARLQEARIYLHKYPKGDYTSKYINVADEIIERVGKDNPEWVI